MVEEEYVSTEKAAAMLGVTSAAVLTWATAGRLPGAFRTPGGERRGGDWRIPVSTIEAFKSGERSKGDE